MKSSLSLSRDGLKVFTPSLVVLVAAALIVSGFFVLTGVAQAVATLNVIPQELSFTLSSHVDADANASRNGGVVTLLANEHAVDWSDASEARITIQASDVGITTLNDLTNMSWDVNVFSGYLPHVDVYLDLNDNGAYDSGTDDVLVFEYAKVDNSNCDNSPYPTGILNTFDDKGIFEDLSYGWLNSGDPGPCGGATFYSHSLSDWKTGQTENGKTINGSSKILRFELEVDAWISNSESEVSNIVVNSETYYGSIQAAVDAASSGDTIQVTAGTYTEDLVISAGKNNLDVSGTSATIKGVQTSDAGNPPDGEWPLARPNIEILSDGVKLHGFVIQSPDYAIDRYSSGIVIGAQNIEIYSDTFEVAAGNDANGDEISQAIQTYHESAMPGVNISGLNIHDNTFTNLNSGTSWGYEGVYVNRDTTGGTLVTIQSNQFTGELIRAITVERAEVNITGNTIITNLPPMSSSGALEGISIRDAGAGGPLTQTNITISSNSVKGFDSGKGFLRGIRIGITGQTLTNITVNNNTIEGNTNGVLVKSSAGGISLSSNTINNNTTGINNEDAAVLDATNNFWGAASGPSGEGAGAGDAVSANVNYRPWLLEVGGVSYDQTVALTGANQWTLVSAPTLLSEAPAVVDDAAGVVALLVYDGTLPNPFNSPTTDDADIVKPVSAFYVKTPNKGGVGFKYFGDGSPSQTSKQLSAGWNLVGTNTSGEPADEFSTVKSTNDPDGKGLTTLYVPVAYNAHKDLTGEWSGPSNQDIDITNWPSLSLNPYDGYWVFMNAAKAFVKQLLP